MAARKVWALGLYGVLLVLSGLTLGDWRLRLGTMAVVGMFAARTWWAPAGPPERRSQAAPPVDAPPETPD